MPLFILGGEIPYSILYVLYIILDLHTTKLDPRALTSVFLGYSHT